MLSVTVTGRGGKCREKKARDEAAEGWWGGGKVKEEWLCITCRRHSVGSLLFIKLTFTGKWRLACKQSEYSVRERARKRERKVVITPKTTGTSLTGIPCAHTFRVNAFTKKHLALHDPSSVPSSLPSSFPFLTVNHYHHPLPNSTHLVFAK